MNVTVSPFPRSPFMVPPLLVHRHTNSSSAFPWHMTALSTHFTTLEIARTDGIDGGQSARTLQVVGTFTPCTYTLHMRSSVTTMLHVTCRMPLGPWVTLQYSTEVESGKTCQLHGRRMLVKDGFRFSNAELGCSRSLPSGCNCNRQRGCLEMC